MKAWVHVSLKKSVLDPQGKTVHAALQRLGYGKIAAVRQGKSFELELEPALSETEARQLLERIAHEVLANPVIEEYRVELQPTETGG